MNKLFTNLLTLAAVGMFTMNVQADLAGNGYYRVRNYGSERWASVIDDKGSIDANAANADLHAMKLVRNTDEIIGDPGSVLYISNIKNNEYNIACQGTSVQTLLGYTVNIKSDGTAPDGQKVYRAYGTYQGAVKYLGDGNYITAENYGTASVNVNSSATKFVQWYILPIETESDNFFGPKPTLNVEGKLYNPLFTSFAYSLFTPGMKAYYIGRVGFGMAEMIEIDGAIPAGSPVILECAGETSEENRVKLETFETALPNNSLKGVYFNYAGKSQTNHVAYDPNTMRVLGKCSDGSLGYITADIDFLPANSSYLVVPAGSAPEFKCVSTEEYEANISQAPEQIYMIGSMQNWNYNDASYVLLPQGDYEYSGQFEVEAAPEDGPISFRFYTALGTGSENCIGAFSSDDSDVTVELKDGKYLAPYSPDSQSAWTIQNWPGGEITAVLNLQQQTLSLSVVKSGISVIFNDNDTDKIYNLMGMPVNRDDMKAGVYIVNGKKVMVK